MNACRVCGLPIPPTGRAGRPRTVHIECQDEADRRDARDAAEHTERAAEHLPEPIKAGPAPSEPAAAAELVELIQRLAGSSVDADQVRKIATDAALDVVAELDVTRPTQVVIDGVEMPEIEGAQHEVFETVLKLIGLGLHTYLVGPPGTGKSTIAHHAANALGLEYGAIACGPTTPTSRLWGFVDAGGTYHRTEFRERFEFGGVFLLDEMDNGHPGILAELNQALANGHAAFPDGMVARHEGFIVVATANTYGSGSADFVGRCSLDKATLDRFIKVDVPIDETLESKLVGNGDHAERWLKVVRQARTNARHHGLKVIISPRAAVNGARMLAAGFELAKVLDMTFLGGLSEDQRAKLMSGIER